MQEELPYNFDMLLQRMASDDDELAFRGIFDHYKVPFYATALKMARSEHSAEEIVQEVFVTMWVKRKLIAEARCPEKYIYTILHNCIYSHFRKLVQQRKLKLKIELEGEKIENMVEALLLEKENRLILKNVISQLPPQQKLIYKLAKQEGMSREQIARQLNLSPNTVRNHLTAAIEYLRTCLINIASAIIWLHL